ncbi:MAG TPA: MoxR family ATPase [Chloroflexia bacterium]|nr:MoxR family ATPase [Chloroflexia bacterium]
MIDTGAPRAGEEIQQLVSTLETALAGVIVGQRAVVRGTLTALLAGGHVLLEGVPGLGKTLLVRTLAACLDVSYSRIQFTPDLMPADITGTEVLAESPEGRHFSFQRGPIFAHLVLADEINRATPRTQAAMLEAMQELAVTIGRASHPLPAPFFVLATQNPIDLQGTYPLPEAQLDRFFFKLVVEFPSLAELKEIGQRTTTGHLAVPGPVMDAETLLRLQAQVREIPVAEPVLDYAARLVMASHPEQAEAAPAARRFVRYGASPRAIQTLIQAGKINALLSGRYNVAFEDVQRVLLPALRHRLVLNVEAQLQNVTADSILQQIRDEVRP